VPGLRRLSRRVLDSPWLRPFHRLAQAWLGVSKLPGRLTGVSARARRAREQRPGEDVVIVTANLCHDWPRYRRTTSRLEAFARLVEDARADVVLLQEVARTETLWVDRWLADRLGMDYLYSRVNGHRETIGFEEGLAVFSSLPVEGVRTRRLSDPGSVTHRLALGARLQPRQGPLWVFSVHLSLRRRKNARQVSELERWVGDVAGGASAVVGGDFNAHETTPQMARARRTWLDAFRLLNPIGDGTTHAIRWPWGAPLRKLRLDYLFLRHGEPGWQVIESRRLDSSPDRHSDHSAVLARLRPVPAA
jgi:endonuclease/exonuclease/phosphatase family metal-dependent hydrolase